MADVDAELIERVVRWCAEAGRQAVAAEIRGALAPLSWDELLAVRALLADPPPARPLGPQALADMARGAPADVAAERERGGRYRREDLAEDAAAPALPSPEPARPAARSRGRGKAKPVLIIRRARDRAPPPVEEPHALPDVDELRRPEGRAELERLLRRLGARRRAILAELAGRFRRPDGAAPEEADLEALLDHHGLSHAFARREKDELLHALRAAGGVRAAAAARLALDEPGLEAAIVRLGAAGDVERIRDERRAELRGRATLAERVRLLLADEPRLRDLGLLDELEADLRKRLPEHLRALRGGAEPLRAALAASLSITSEAAEGLAARIALDLGPPDRTGPRGPRFSSSGAPRRRDERFGERPRGRAQGGVGREGAGRRGPGTAAGPRGGRGEVSRRERSSGPAASPRDARPGRPGGPPSSRRPGGSFGSSPRPSAGASREGFQRSRPSGPRAPGLRPGGPRAPGSRPSGPRAPGSRPSGPPASGARPSAPRAPGSRPGGARGAASGPAGSRPAGPRPATRPLGSPPRPAGPRAGGARADRTGPRSSGPRSGGPSPRGSRPPSPIRTRGKPGKGPPRR